MNCPKCHASIQQPRQGSDTMLRTRGLVLKHDSIAVICPKCKSDVPLSPTMMKAMQNVAVLFFKNR